MKDFDAEAVKVIATDAERTFKVSGETFMLRKRIRPETLGVITLLGEGAVAEQIMSLEEVMQHVLTAESIPRWRTLRESDDEDRMIDFETMASIAGWAVGVVLGRPLESASSLPTPPTISEPVSTVASSPLAAVPSTG